jgi:hypothetical protein
MTETEWLACSDPAPLFRYVEEGAKDRKLRLFAVACCRSIWHLITHEEARTVVETAERYADRPSKELNLWSGPGNLLPDQWPDTPATRAAWETAYANARVSARRARAFAVDAVRASGGIAERMAEWQRQCALIRCIFGDPFARKNIDRTWVTPTTKKMAELAYEERRFDDLPILADALEDAGCDNADILNHCRQPGEHVRGCWVVDLLTGRN